MENTNQQSNGSLTAIILVILIVLFAGGSFLWKYLTTKPHTEKQTSEQALRNDLQATEDVNIDTDLKDIDTIYESK